MKPNYLLVVLLLSFWGCNSVKKSNRFLSKRINPMLLKQDVDEVNTQLQKFHPNLYWYITKKDLDYKFDSLKNTIQTPLTPNEFYFKLAPIISQIKEGHLRLKMPHKRYDKEELEAFKLKTPLFGQLSYKIINGRLYIAEVHNKALGVKVGDEVLKIGDDNVKDLILKYGALLHADGYNVTYYKHGINNQFLNYYTLDHGLLNKVSLYVKEDKSVREVFLERTKKSTDTLIKPLRKVAQNKMYDYDEVSKSFNRSMKFLSADSSIAYMKVKSFSHKKALTFYKDTFNKLKNAKSKYLILDIRNNLGGSLEEINNLYSFIAQKDFTLVKTPEMNFKNASLHRNYFHGLSTMEQVVSSIVYPGFVMGNLWVNKSGEDGKYYYQERASKETKVNKSRFVGRVYLLVNGSSFSASAILAAKFKNDKRGLIIGEETGGANDGTVAGFYNTIQLKNSHLKLPIGLLLIQPNIDFQNQNRGVMPDVTITYDPFQFNDKKDKEMEWVLDDIQKKHD